MSCDKGDVPLISVVMPVHNSGPFLEESVRSLLGQSLSDFELILGDDGSNDGSGALLDRLAGEDARIRLLRRPAKSGLANSANWVVGEARAPLVAIAHGDDVSFPRRLERLAGLLQRHPEASAAATPAVGIDEAGRPVQPANLWRLLHASPFAPFAHSSVMFRRAAFDAAGGYRARCDYWEDLDLWWRMADLGPILVLPEPLVGYRHWEGSVRGSEGVSETERALGLMYRCADRYWRHEDYDELLAAESGRAGAPCRVRPRVFVARSWLSVWRGKRPGVLGHIVRRGRLRFDGDTLVSLAFVGWATLSPLTLRLFLRGVLRARNRLAILLLRGAGHVRWRPRRPGERRETTA